MLLENSPYSEVGASDAMPTEKTSLLVFGINYAPELIGIGPYTAGLAEEMAARGHRVRAVVGQPYYPSWRVQKRAGRAWQSGTRGGVEVTYCPLYVPRRPTALRRLAHYASFAATAALPLARAIMREKPSAVLAIAPSLAAVPVAALAAHIAGAPLWLHVQDFEVEMAFATGMLSADTRLGRVARNFEKSVLLRGDIVSTISQKMCQRLDVVGVDRERIMELRNWANHAERIDRADSAEIRREWGLEGKTIALYSGNIAAKQGLEVVVDAARALSARRDLVFVICGEGPNREELEARAEGLGNVVFRPLAKEEQFAEVMKAADIHLMPQVAGAADLVLPSKLPNMLASGKPVVATAAAGTGLANEVMGCGLVVPPGDAAALARAVEKVARDRELAEALGAEGRRRAGTRWAMDLMANRFEKRLGRLVAEQAQMPISDKSEAMPAR